MKTFLSVPKSTAGLRQWAFLCLMAEWAQTGPSGILTPDWPGASRICSIELAGASLVNKYFVLYQTKIHLSHELEVGNIIRSPLLSSYAHSHERNSPKPGITLNFMPPKKGCLLGPLKRRWKKYWLLRNTKIWDRKWI